MVSFLQEENENESVVLMARDSVTLTAKLCLVNTVKLVRQSRDEYWDGNYLAFWNSSNSNSSLTTS